jgi:hypothetical protein
MTDLTQSALVSRVEILAQRILCPTCGVAIGQPCLSPNGQETQAHIARERASTKQRR